MTKRFLMILVMGLLICSTSFAKPVLLECKEDEPLDQDTDFYAYYSLDFGKKKYLYKAGVWVAKSCALGNCKEIKVHNSELPFKQENATHLYLGFEWKSKQDGADVFDSYTFNKTNLVLVNYWNDIYDKTTNKRMTSQDFYTCKKINKFPF